jgi:hypothetical protein
VDNRKIMSLKYIVESECVVRAVDKPFNERQKVAVFNSADSAYQFIEKYLEDTKTLHVYFARSQICSKDEYEDNIENDKCIAVNIVLGQFEDMIYVRKVV